MNYPTGSGCSCRRTDCQNVGKHPATRHGIKDAAATREAVAELWRRDGDANVAVLTGRESEVFVLDVDPRNDGDRSLRDLIAANGALPQTVTAETGGGGQHFYFRYPADGLSGRSSFLPGLDIKSDGGCVTAPPSVHASGGVYTWRHGCGPDDLEVAPAPSWLLDLIRRPKQEGAPASATAGFLLNVGEGERNNAAARLAGLLLGGRPDVPLVHELLRMWNSTNVPPLPADEVAKIVTSVAAREAAKAQPVSIPERWARPAADLLAQPVPETMWTICGLWTDAGCGFIAGPPKTGKTWLLLEMALAVSSGRKFLDRFEVGRRGNVLYLAAEDRDVSIRKRLELLAAGRGVPGHDWSGVVISTAPVNISADEWKAAIRGQCETLRPALVVADPLSRIHYSDENSSEAMKPILDFLRSLSRDFGCAVAVSHHLRKGGAGRFSSGYASPADEMRGSGDFRAWQDVGWVLSPRGDGFHATLEAEMREAPAPDRLLIEYGFQKEGMVTLAVIEDDGQDLKASIKQRVLDYLANHGATAFQDIAETRAVQGAKRSKREALAELESEGKIEVRFEEGQAKDGKTRKMKMVRIKKAPLGV